MLTPFSSPFYILAKPVGSRCNLSCQYCYYLSKDGGQMSPDLLETFIRQYIEAQSTREVLFTWHGGEPLLLPVAYYRRALSLQQKYANGHHIDNCLQTNGTLLTDEWCTFFRRHNFLIGVSIDGPEMMHDSCRRQFHQVMHGVGLLKKHGVMWNALATVNRYNADNPVAFYRFFRDLGCEYLQFTPVVEPGPPLSAFNILPSQWGPFLISLYDEWAKADVGRISVQMFETTLANWLGLPSPLCSMSANCGRSAALQPDGTLYSCDHFVFPEYRLGNIREHTIVELMYGDRQRRFGAAKYDTLSAKCRQCPFLFACHGECPKNRILPRHENYLCEGYLQFFRHVAADMDDMAARLRTNAQLSA